jgi:hypothetical protein
MGQVVMNVPQSLQPGTYRLIVQTAYGSGARINKTVRKGVFEEIVTVM